MKKEEITCPKCNSYRYVSIDSSNKYYEHCADCNFTVNHNKLELMNNFVCSQCGSKECEEIDTDELYALRCKNCSKEQIMFTKNEIIVNTKHRKRRQDNGDEVQQWLQKQRESKIPRCPKCGSTFISTGKRGYTLLSGFIGANKTVNRCQMCGKTWFPKL